jgi:hypothetical protein
MVEEVKNGDQATWSSPSACQPHGREEEEDLLLL